MRFMVLVKASEESEAGVLPSKELISAMGDYNGVTTMRFMVLVKASEESEAGVLPSKELISAMGDYNEELVKAGVLLAAEGLQASSKGARVVWSGGRRTVVDGPFTEAKELVAGFWLLQVKSKDEAVEWAQRIPFGDGAEVEVRQVFEASDFPGDIVPSKEAAREESLREELRNRADTP